MFYGLGWLNQMLQQVTNHTTGILQVSGIFVILGISFAQFIFVLNIILSFLRKNEFCFMKKLAIPIQSVRLK